MARHAGIRAERDRGDSPDKDRKKNINRGEEDPDISRQRGRRGERDKKHDREDMDEENE